MTALRGAGSFARRATPVLLGLVLFATLTPRHGQGEPMSGLCLICGARGTADAISNFLLFLPLGMALRWRLSGPYTAVAAALVLSGSIEGVQFLVPGRYPTIGDLLFNALGAVAGVYLVGRATVLLDPGEVAGRRLTAMATLVSVALLVATAALLQPSLPESVYYGQWTPALGHLEAYEGRVLEASIDGVATPSARLADSDSVRARLLAGAPVRIVIRPGRRPPGLAPIFSVFDERQREIVLFGIDDRDLVLRYRSRAAALRLDQPDLRVANAAFDRSASTLTWIAGLRDEGFFVTVDGREIDGPLAHTAGRGWAMLLYPERLARRFADGLDFLWVFLVTLPIGYWAPRGRRAAPPGRLAAQRGRRAARRAGRWSIRMSTDLALAVPVVAASLLAPATFAHVALSPWVVLATLIGPLAGRLLRRASRRPLGIERREGGSREG